MTERIISYRYAKSLLETAAQEGLDEVIYNDFQKVKTTFELSRELRSLTASPVFQIWRKKKVYQELFTEEKISDLAMNFLLLIINKRRGELIPSIISQYEILFNQKKNLLPVDIVSALELPNNIKEMVVKRLTDLTKKTVLSTFKIDSSIKGGIVIKIEDWVFDASIKNQLEVLYKDLALGQIN